MRITGGILRGRLFDASAPGVRPTQDRVRAALFSILGPVVQEGRFLDLFAGSGAVGLEAWSRGALETVWVERRREVAKILRRNVARLCDSRARVFVMDVFDFLKKRVADGRFRIIFCDPPYETLVVYGGLGRLLDAIRGAGIMEESGVVVVEHGGGTALSPLTAWDVFDERVYGDARLVFLRRADGGEKSKDSAKSLLGQGDEQRCDICGDVRSDHARSHGHH